MIQNDNNKRRIIMLAPTTSQPRHHRRAKMFLEYGYKITVYAFSRGLYEENSYPENVEIKILGHIESGKYYSRIPKIVQAIFKIKNSEGKTTKPCYVYCFGLDMALIGTYSMPKSVPIIYEIGDVQNPLPHNNFSSKLLGFFEKYILNKCKLLTITSPGFYTDYFKKLCPGVDDKLLVIENKLSKDIAKKFSRPSEIKNITKPIKIGYIGAFKYENCIFPLIYSVAKRQSDYELHFYGDGACRNKILEFVSQNNNIFYHGSFNSNQDLEKIYQSVDLSYVVYDNKDMNVRMALPNKLYDGPYFGVPLIVAENTLLAKKVRNLGIGIVVDPSEANFTDKLLDNLDVTKVIDLSKKTLELNEKEFVENYKKPIQRINSISQ